MFRLYKTVRYWFDTFFATQKTLTTNGLLLFLFSNVCAVPLTVISPFAVNTAAGYTITQSGLYVLSDDTYVNLPTAQAININTNNVVLDLNGKTLVGNPASGVHAIVVGASSQGNVTIKNGSINQWGGSGVHIDLTNSKTGIVIDNVNILRTNRGIVNEASVISGVFKMGIRNSTVSLTTSTGIALNGANDLTIDNCMVQGCGFEGLTFSGQNITVINSRFSRNVTAATTISGAGILVATATSVLIDNAQVNDNTNGGILLQSPYSAIIRNCTLQANTGTALAVQSTSSQILVRNNLFVGNNVGIASNTPNASFIGNLAYANTTTNYLLQDNAALFAIQVTNGAQLNPGVLIDTVINNISIAVG